MRDTVPGWPGYIHKQKNGQRLFIIEKQITVSDDDGRKVRHRFHVSTGAHDIDSAREQLSRFESNPFAYSRAGDADELGKPLLLTTDLCEKFYAWQVETPPGRKRPRVTPKYARETYTWLLRWVKQLRGVDLRRMSIRKHILPLFDASPPGARRPLMASIKTVCSWLRTERHEFDGAVDVTRDLKLPQWMKHGKKRVVPLEHVREVAKKLTRDYRDCLYFQVATGAHVTELRRFVRDSSSKLLVYPKPLRLADGSKALGQVEFWHKKQAWHKVALTRREHLDACVRLRKRGVVPERLNATIYAACDAAKVPRFSFVMRHSVATWAETSGVARSITKSHLGHENESTTEGYIDTELPTSAIPAVRL